MRLGTQLLPPDPANYQPNTLAPLNASIHHISGRTKTRNVIRDFFFFFVRITLREFHNQRRKTSFFSGLSDRSSKQMERGSERGAMEGETEELKNHSLASLKHIIKVKRGAERERESITSEQERSDREAAKHTESGEYGGGNPEKERFKIFLYASF